MADVPTIRIGYVPEHYLTPLHLALRSPAVASLPFKIEVTPFPSGTGHMITSLRSNEIDVAIGLTEGWVAGLTGKTQPQNPAEGGYKVVGHWVDNPLRWAIVTGRNRGEVNGVSDLKDQRVGISRLGSGSHIMSFVLAQQQGWKSDSLTSVPLGPFGALRSGVTGQNEAKPDQAPNPTAEFFMWEHFTTKPYFHATAEKPNPPLKKIGEIFTPWPSWMIVASTALFPDPEKDTRLQSLFQALDLGIKEFEADTAQVIKLLGTGELGCTYIKEDATEWLKDVKFTNGVRGVDAKVIEGVVDVLKVAGVIDTGMGYGDAIERGDSISMSDSDKVALIWKRAIDQYETITKKKLEDSTLKEIKTVDALITVIEDENRLFSGFRAKGHRLCTVLKYAMIPVELVGSLIGSGASNAYPPSAVVFRGVRLLLQAAKGVSDKYDAIINMMVALKACLLYSDFTSRLEIYSQRQISSQLGEKLAEILTTLLEVLAFARQEIRHGRLLSYGKNILMLSDGGSSAMAKLDRLVQGETALVGAETLTQVQVANLKLSQMDQNVGEITQHLKRMNTGIPAPIPQEQDTISRLKQILQPSTGAQDRYRAINRSRVPETGDWIRDDKAFLDWMEGRKAILWVSGNPGAGKSYIACNIVNYLKQHRTSQQGAGIPIGFFFFKDDDSKTRSVHQALRDVAFQIAQNDIAYAAHIECCVDSEADIETLQPLWQKLFVDFFIEKRGDSRAYVILDALDEAFIDDRAELFELAKDVTLDGHIQFLMLGRPQVSEEMNELMETIEVPTIYVSEVNNFNDIVHYVRTSISRSVYLRKLPQDLQSEIVDIVSTGAQGMFIWAGLMLQELLRVRNIGGIRKTLAGAPKGLTKMIKHVLKGFSESLKDDPDYAEDVNELLAWTVCARRPLKLIEVDNILKWRNPESEGWIWLEGSLRVQFASVFSLSREDGLTTADLQRLGTLNSVGLEDPFAENLDVDELDVRGKFDSDPDTTEVAFNHASWGDFFRGEEGMVCAEGSPLIGVNYHEAQVLIMTRCLEVFHGQDPSPGGISLALRPCAGAFMFAILDAIDISKCTKDEKKVIGLHLAQLLSTDSILKNFLETATLPNLFSKDIADLLNKWLGNTDVQDSLPDEMKTWYKEIVSTNEADILRPIARHLSRLWFSPELVWKQGAYCVGVFDFLNLRNSEPSSPVNSLEKVLAAAEWSQFPKDAVWHEKVGRALGNRHLYGDAIEYFQKALDLDATLWTARYAMAQCCRNQGQFSRAAQLYESVIEELQKKERSSTFRRHFHQICRHLAYCYWHLEDWGSTLAIARKGHEDDDQCVACAALTLDAYHKEERYDEILNCLRRMDKTSDKGITPLIEFLLTSPSKYNMLYFGFGSVIRHIGSAPFFLKAYTSAIETAHQRMKPILAANLELCLAYILQVYEHDSDCAAAVYERLVETYQGSRAEGDLMSVLDIASHRLSTHYLEQCLRDNISNEEQQIYGWRLERLARGKSFNARNAHSEQVFPGGMSFLPNPRAGLVLGHFYKLLGREADAEHCFKALLKQQLRALSGNNSKIDRSIFLSLAIILAAIGDEESATGALYQEDILGIQRRAKLGDERNICDGCCALCSIDGITMCVYCEDVQLCEKCFLRLKSGTLPVNVCGPRHKWLVVPPRPEHVRNRKQEYRSMVYVGGDWLSVEDFKLYLKGKHGL